MAQRKKPKTDEDKFIDEILRRSRDPAFTAKMTRAMVNRNLGEAVSALRIFARLTQQQVADQLGCCPTKIGKIENDHDYDTKIRDLVEIAMVCGHDLILWIVPKKRTAKGWIRAMVGRIRRSVLNLESRSKLKPEKVLECLKFLDEASYRLGQFIELLDSDHADLVEEGPWYLHVERLETEDK